MQRLAPKKERSRQLELIRVWQRSEQPLYERYHVLRAMDDAVSQTLQVTMLQGLSWGPSLLPERKPIALETNDSCSH